MAKEAVDKVTIGFEEATARLEQVVASLEEGNLTLDQSLAAFQEGIDLLRTCIGHLNHFDEKVELLLTEYYAEAPDWLGDGGRPK